MKIAYLIVGLFLNDSDFLIIFFWIKILKSLHVIHYILKHYHKKAITGSNI